MRRTIERVYHGNYNCVTRRPFDKRRRMGSILPRRHGRRHGSLKERERKPLCWSSVTIVKQQLVRGISI